MGGIKWSSKEDSILINNYIKYATRNTISQLLPNRSAAAIVWRASILGLRAELPSVKERLIENTKKHSGVFGEDNKYPTECWEWTGYIDNKGYGSICINGVALGAHRVFYKVFVGDISDDLTVDHLCRNRKCVNPSHMELVDLVTNVMRGNSDAAANKRKTHCKRGHEFNKTNTYITPNGNRICKICRREIYKKYYYKQKGQQ